MQLVFAPEERDVCSYERTHRSLAPLGAKLDSGTNAEAGQGGCAPTQLRSKERTASYKYLAPTGRSDKQQSVALPS